MSSITTFNCQMNTTPYSIHHDLEPFWGLKPQDLIALQKSLESKVDSYTIGNTKEEGISVVHYAFTEGKYNQLIKGSEKIIDLLSDVEQYLPPFRAVFSPHDGPNRLSDYAIRATTLDAATKGTFVQHSDIPGVNAIGWMSACSASSPARRKPLNLDKPPPRPTRKTFIYDHRLSMDPCLHPGHFHHHGQFLSHGIGPTPQHIMFPEFSYCSTTIHHNIRIPTPYGWVQDIYPRSDDPGWEDKLDVRLLWRGSNTGIFHADHIRWHASHRNFLVSYANTLGGTKMVLNSTMSATERVGKPREVRNAYMNPAMFDIAFAGEPLACSPGICDSLQSIYTWREVQSLNDAGKYKYVLDVS